MNLEKVNETWKDIPGYEGSYQASDQGKIRSLNRLTSYNRRRKSQIIKEQSLLKYRRVMLHDNCYKNSYCVHKLVWEAFNGKVLNNLIIDHIDSNTINNKLSNLRLVNSATSALKGMNFDSRKSQLQEPHITIHKDKRISSTYMLYQVNFRKQKLHKYFNYKYYS